MKSSLHDNESMLLRRVAAGDGKAFRVLYDRYRNQVFYFAFKFLKSESAAEDVLQEVYSKIWINRAILVDIVCFSKYLNTLTINYVYNLLRRKAHEQAYLQEVLSKINVHGEEAFNAYDHHELQQLIHKAIKQLPLQQKKVFELSRLQGLKHDDIAKQLNISRETVKKHIMEALRNVKVYLATQGEIVITTWIILLLIK